MPATAVMMQNLKSPDEQERRWNCSHADLFDLDDLEVSATDHGDEEGGAAANCKSPFQNSVSALQLAEDAHKYHCTRLTAPVSVDPIQAAAERRKRLQSMKMQHQSQGDLNYNHVTASATTMGDSNGSLDWDNTKGGSSHHNRNSNSSRESNNNNSSHHHKSGSPNNSVNNGSFRGLLKRAASLKRNKNGDSSHHNINNNSGTFQQWDVSFANFEDADLEKRESDKDKTNTKKEEGKKERPTGLLKKAASLKKSKKKKQSATADDGDMACAWDDTVATLMASDAEDNDDEKKGAKKERPTGLLKKAASLKKSKKKKQSSSDGCAWDDTIATLMDEANDHGEKVTGWARNTKPPTKPQRARSVSPPPTKRDPKVKGALLRRPRSERLKRKDVEYMLMMDDSAQEQSNPFPKQPSLPKPNAFPSMPQQERMRRSRSADDDEVSPRKNKQGDPGLRRNLSDKVPSRRTLRSSTGKQQQQSSRSPSLPRNSPRRATNSPQAA